MDFKSRFTGSGQAQKLAFLVAGILIGGTVVFLGVNGPTASSGQAVGEELVSTLENQSGQQLELVNVEQSNGLYTVNVKNSENQLSTYYVTRDGEKFTSSMVDVSNLKQTLAARDDFRACLSEKNVAIYGNLSQRTTVAQIQILGGVQVVQPVYRDVNRDPALEEAVERGVQRVPAIYYNGSVRQGLQRLPEVENFTGCSFSTS